MYSIIHLNTNSYYALIHNDKHSVVFFDRFKDAKYVADSLATHTWIYGHLPNMSNELHMMKRYQKKQNSFKHNIWVTNRKFSKHRVHELGLRNLNASVVKSIKWNNDDEYNVDISHLFLHVDMETYAKVVSLDNTNIDFNT